MNVDMWDRNKWTSELKKFDVLVMTPQIMLDLLRHAYFPISSVSSALNTQSPLTEHLSWFLKVSLLVIDEVHHARGGHPYARILTEHYAHCLPESERPKIFGLTASPIWNAKKPQESLK